MSTLVPAERIQLRLAEQVIEHGLKSFVEVGEALAQVRDERLYRGEHDTFEDYCQERWGLSASYARDMIGGASQAVAIATVDPGAPAPANLGQARALTGLEPEQAAETMRAAHEATDGNLTAAAIKAARPDAPAPADAGEAEAGAGLPLPVSPAMRGLTSESHPQGEAGTYSSDADAVGALASEGPTPPAAFEHGNSAPPEAPRPQVSPLEAIVRDHEQNSTSAWRKRFAAEMARSGDLFRNIPADVAENAGPELLELLEQHIVWANDWHSRVKKAQPNRLTVINGGSR